MEMVVDAASLEEAAVAARRRHVHVMSVSPAEVPQSELRSGLDPASAVRRASVAPYRGGKNLRRAMTLVLITALFAAAAYPIASSAVGAALLVSVGVFVLVPSTRNRLRSVLGVWPDMPVRGSVKLAFLGAYSLLVLLLAFSGPRMLENQRRAKEQQLAEDAAVTRRMAELAAEVRSVLADARAALRGGDIVKGEALARQAVTMKGAPNLEEAQGMLRKIEQSADPEHVLGLLTSLPEEEFAAFREDGHLTASLDQGFEVLNARLLEVAGAQMAGAVSAREKLTAQRKAQQEKARRETEQKLEQQRAQQEAALRAQQQRLDEFLAAIERAKLNSLVTNVSVQRVGDTGWEATLTVANDWHYVAKQVRLQGAQALWKIWAQIASPAWPDGARIKIVDFMENEVGGSRVWGGSLIWVAD